MLDLVVATEKGNWSEISPIADDLEISEETLTESYLDAIEWGNGIFLIENEEKTQETVQ